VNRTRSLRRSPHLCAVAVEDAPGPGYFNRILGDSVAAGSRSLGEALDAVDNDAAVQAVGADALDLMVSV
jgi:hypothetical protein